MSAIVIYFVFSSSVPLRLNFGKINPRAIKNTIGTYVIGELVKSGENSDEKVEIC